MAAKKKNKGGQPTRWSKTLMPILKKLYLDAHMTDKQVAEIIRVKEQTVNNWKKKYPEFFESMKDWKAQADEKVEMALYERSVGYEHPETKFQYDKDRGRDGEWVSIETVKHYPPDTQAASLWLRNRKPKVWRDTKGMEHTGKDGEPLVVNISPTDAGVL